jgi:hypothetical protein
VSWRCGAGRRQRARVEREAEGSRGDRAVQECTYRSWSCPDWRRYDGGSGGELQVRLSLVVLVEAVEGWTRSLAGSAVRPGEGGQAGRQRLSEEDLTEVEAAAANCRLQKSAPCFCTRLLSWLGARA